MKTIVVEDDVYGYLVRHTQQIGEDASSILRRLLGVDTSHAKTLAEAQNTFDFLRHPELFMHLNVAHRFLFILSWAYRQDPDRFATVSSIEGSRRKYFARGPGVLQASGKSVNPRPIPDSPFWVITNNSTARKHEILSHVFRVLGYEAEDTNAMLRVALKI